VKASDVYENVTAAIVEALEAGEADPTKWRAPWHRGLGLPRNAQTTNVYRGGNTLVLWAAQLTKNYPTAWWATYRQWTALGAQVRKGERAAYGVKWVEPSGKRDVAAGKDRKPTIVPIGFAVFNASQVDGWEPPQEAVGLALERVEEAEAFFAATGSNVLVGGDEACYVPSLDVIRIPVLEAFKNIEGYYATLSHEHIHYTGAESRLNRVQSGTFGGSEYAFEELVAELGSAFVCATLGLVSEPRPDHAQYLASWLAALRHDPKALYRAAGLAQKAADFLAAFSVKLEEVAA
jgi:antirestriction protein ArdC